MSFYGSLSPAFSSHGAIHHCLFLFSLGELHLEYRILNIDGINDKNHPTSAELDRINSISGTSRFIQ